MSKNSKNSDIFEDFSKKYVGQYFDGIRFLWQIPKIKYFLKLMILLLISMILYYFILFIILSFFGKILLYMALVVFGELIFFGIFCYILVELTEFYKISKKNKLSPEKNKFLKMKFWPEDYTTSKSYRLIYLIIISVIIIVYGISLFTLAKANLFFIVVEVGAYIFLSLILFSFLIFGVLAFLSTKNTMKSYEARYSEKFYNHAYWIILLFPLPWIYFLTFFYTHQYIIMIDSLLYQFITWSAWMYLIMGFIGLISLFKKSWRVGYTTSLIAGMLTILTVIIIPFIIDSIIGLGGLVISFIVIIILFIQGTLDENGEKLYEYYKAWDEKLLHFNINSEKDIRSLNENDVFFSTSINSDASKAPYSLVINLWILIYTLYLYTYLVGGFLQLSEEEAVSLVYSIQNFINFSQYLAILLTVIVFTFIIMLRQATKEPIFKEVSPKKISSILCDNCMQNVKPDKYCINCGKKLSINCPNCKQLVSFDNFCEKCGASISNFYK